jgi:hypothetical protein
VVDDDGHVLVLAVGEFVDADVRQIVEPVLVLVAHEYAALPAQVRQHLVCRVVDRIEPIVQKHQIEGLLMGVP